MEYRNIDSGSYVQRHLKEGVSKLSDIVGATLGPNGRTILIEKEQSPIATKDGVTVARHVKFNHPIQNMAAQVIKSVSDNTHKEAGDGTTTATILAHAIFENSRSAKNYNNHLLRLGMNKAVQDTVKLIEEEAIEFTNDEDGIEIMKRVAFISSNGDQEIADLVVSAINEVGDFGACKIESAAGTESFVRKVNGLTYSGGMKSPNFMATDKKRMIADLSDVLIFICEHKINNLANISSVLEYSVEVGKPILIMCDDIDPSALQVLILNKSRGLNCVVIRTPGFGYQRQEVMEDIATLTGGIAVTKEKYENLDFLQKVNKDGVQKLLGSSDSTIVSKEDFIIVKGGGDPLDIKNRKDLIKKQLEEEKDGFMKSKYEERLAKLTEGIATIFVGGHSDIEVEEKKDRFDDALRAVKASIEKGIVPGGGNCLRLIKGQLEKEFTSFDDYSVDLGYKIIVDSLDAPFLRILKNSFIDINDYKGVLSPDRKGEGIDASKREVVNLIEEGIIDPAKVIITALENANSVSGTLLTTYGVIYESSPEIDDLIKKIDDNG